MRTEVHVYTHRPLRPFAVVVANPLAWMAYTGRVILWLLVGAVVLTVWTLRAMWRLAVAARWWINDYFERRQPYEGPYTFDMYATGQEPNYEDYDRHHRRVYDGLPDRIKSDFCSEGPTHLWDTEDPRFTGRPDWDPTLWANRECTQCHHMQANPEYRGRPMTTHEIMQWGRFEPVHRYE